MDLSKLYEILSETTIQLRKGEEIEGSPELVEQIKRGDHPTAGGVAEIYMMPHASEAKPELKKIDLEFLVIGVDKHAAERRKAELINILNSYPEPDRLAGGPSYIEVGGVIGDQGAAFQLFALGQVLGIWNVITPASMGITGAEARRLAGSGFVMISGYTAASVAD
jgi:hypothetical protein